MSSIELINPKAESVRRAAALQVWSLFTLRNNLIAMSLFQGQYDGCDGLGECCERKSRCVGWCI